MRDFRVIVPRDCVTALTPVVHRTALNQMRKTIKAEIVDSRRIDFAKLAKGRNRAR
jgi:hypothetical protein